ncbi:MAG: bacteriocin transport accessory protein [Lachnospiraceae bacterium]|nr:bacteriocin transport accessory protein [Lachnospiraceae bacterium]
MMKMKKAGLLMVLCLALAVFGGCGKDSAKNPAEVSVVDTSAIEILETVWNTYGEDEKFPIGGGDSANIVMDVPGNFDVTNVEELDATLGFPATQAEAIDEAASMMHMMNANTFTGGAYHVKDAGQVTTVTDALKENIQNRQWMCGFPDTLVIMVVEDTYIVSFFGNAEIVETFKTKVTDCYGNSSVVVEESLNF